MKIDWEAKCIQDNGDGLVVVILCAGEEVYKHRFGAYVMSDVEAEFEAAKIWARDFGYMIQGSGCFL